MKDWQDELRNSVTTIEQLERYINLTPEERQGLESTNGVFNWGVSPYYASLMDADDPGCPVRAARSVRSPAHMRSCRVVARRISPRKPIAPGSRRTSGAQDLPTVPGERHQALNPSGS